MIFQMLKTPHISNVCAKTHPIRVHSTVIHSLAQNKPYACDISGVKSEIWGAVERRGCALWVAVSPLMSLYRIRNDYHKFIIGFLYYVWDCFRILDMWCLNNITEDMILFFPFIALHTKPCVLTPIWWRAPDMRHKMDSLTGWIS